MLTSEIRRDSELISADCKEREKNPLIYRVALATNGGRTKLERDTNVVACDCLMDGTSFGETTVDVRPPDGVLMPSQ